MKTGQTEPSPDYSDITRPNRSAVPAVSRLLFLDTYSSNQMTWLEVLGILFLSLIVYRLVWWLACFLYFHLAQQFTPVHLVKGQWAVVTGATDGVGKAFACKLADEGMNVVLVSRTRSKLDAVASEIEEEFKVNTKVIEADFTEESDEMFTRIEKELQGLEIGVLVNNVGISYPYPDYFLNLKDNNIIYKNILRCNVETLLNMCRIVMPGMVERKKGVVINISSTAADIPSPMLSVYGASKIFVSKFTKDLQTEYRKQGIIVQSLVPGYVATKMSKIRKATWMAPTPKTYVESALKTLGVSSHTTGYFPHSLLLGSIKLMESFLPRVTELMVMRTMENIRSRSLKKNQDIAVQ